MRVPTRERYEDGAVDAVVVGTIQEAQEPHPAERVTGGLVASRVSLLAMRVGMGWFMFYAGWVKLYAEGGWSAERFLLYATKGPFAGIFHAMAGNVLVDMSVMAGELAIGLALILGVATRFTAMSGIALFLPLYLAHLPPVDGWVSAHVIYMLVLGVIGGTRAGTIWGIDSLLEGWEQRFPQLRYLLG